MIKEFVRRIINGPTGMKTFEAVEGSLGVDKKIAASEWTIRCLGNPNCEGSKDVLAAIFERRFSKMPVDTDLREENELLKERNAVLLQALVDYWNHSIPIDGVEKGISANLAAAHLIQKYAAL